jgi:hypothetical protein
MLMLAQLAITFWGFISNPAFGTKEVWTINHLTYIPILNRIFSLLSFLKEKGELKRNHNAVSLYVFVCVPFNMGTNYFHEIWYKNYASGDHPNLKFFHFVQSVITTLHLYEFVRWE